MAKIKSEEGVIRTQLYNKTVEAIFYGPTEAMPGRHMYTINGSRKRSVTGVIGLKDKSIALVPWALEVAAKSLMAVLDKGNAIDEESVVKAVYASDLEKTKAADMGTAIHDFIEQYINFKLKKGDMPSMPEDKSVLVGVNSFLEWESQNKVKFLWAEKLLYSKKNDYMGKADFGAIVNGNRCICDNKTGNGLYKEVRLQLAAYQAADEEETKEKYDGRWAIQIAKESEADYIKRMELKNKIKRVLGKKEVEIPPYSVFNAKFLDSDAKSYKNDFAAFKCLLGVQEWDSSTKL
jgi:hypothetical protein